MAEGLDKETLVAFKDATSEAVNRRIKVSFAGYSDEVSVVLNVKAGCTVTAPKITLQETQHTNRMPLGATAFVDSKTKAELTAEEMDGTYLKEFTNLYAAELTIKILDGAKAQTGISLKAKGSIDLLDREQSKIVYTPSFKNMTAKLTDATFASRDPNKDLFDLSVENGKVVLQAKSGVELSTRQTYQVRMLLTLNNRYMGSVTVR